MIFQGGLRGTPVPNHPSGCVYFGIFALFMRVIGKFDNSLVPGNDVLCDERSNQKRSHTTEIFCTQSFVRRNTSNFKGNTSARRQSKTLIRSTNIDQKSLETELSIAIYRPTSDKWQSKTLLMAIFDSRSSIVKSVFDYRLSGVRNTLTTISPVVPSNKISFMMV